MKNILLIVAILLISNSSRAQWEPDVRLTNDPYSSQTAYNCAHAIASPGDTIHVVWYDYRDGNAEIYYKRSDDKGLSWTDDMRLTYDPSNSRSPSILVSGSTVHVVWEDDRDGNFEIYYKRSLDGGNSWGNDIRLTYTPSYTWHPSLIAADSILHLVYYDYANGWWEIYYQRSTDLGSTWEQPVRLTNDHAGSFWATICSKDTVLHLAWYDGRDGNWQIYYKRSEDNGSTWGVDTRLTFTNDTSWRPCIAVSDSCIHVVWEGYRDHIGQIYYKRSCDGGNTWSNDIRLTDLSGTSIRPNLAASGKGVSVTWVDDRDGNKEIYYKQSYDEGLSWEPDIRLTEDTAESNHPFISVSGPQINVIWYDFRDGNYEIYYKRNPTGGFPVGIGNEKKNIPDKLISVYPNPASTGIKIYSEINSGKISEFTIRNLIGEEVLNGQMKDTNTLIDVSGLENGIYFVGILTENKQTGSAKLIILK